MSTSIQITDANFTVTPVASIFPQPTALQQFALLGSAAKAVKNFIASGTVPALVNTPTFDGVSMSSVLTNSVPSAYLDTGIVPGTAGTWATLVDTHGQTIKSDLMGNWRGTATVPYGSHLFMQANGQIDLEIGGATSGSTQSLFTPPTLTSGKFYLIAARWDAMTAQASVVASGAITNGNLATGTNGSAPGSVLVAGNRYSQAGDTTVRQAAYGVWNTKLLDSELIAFATWLTSYFGTALTVG